MNCHVPHGSNHDKLLVAKLPFLCQRCHLNTRHPGTLYDFRNTIAGTNPSNRAVEHACKNCHQHIHGSNAPSGVYPGGRGEPLSRLIPPASGRWGRRPAPGLLQWGE